MKMSTHVQRRVLIVAALCMLAGSSAESAGQKRQKHSAPAPRVANATVAVQVVFSTHDVQVIREHYAPRYRNLPPGLQKKLRRTGQLPPGWEKKFEPFPVVLERKLVVLPDGYRRGVFDGHAMIFNPRTQIIFDVAVLF